MIKERKLLGLVVVMALLAHAGALFWLHNLSVSIGLSWRSKGEFSMTPTEIAERNNQFLAEIFETLAEPAMDRVCELKELHTESSSLALFITTSASDLSLSQTPLSFEPQMEEIAIDKMDQENLPHFEFGEPLATTAPCREAPTPQLSFKTEPLDSYGAIAGSDHFDLQVEYAPKYFDSGYVFKITLTAKKEAQFKRIRQNYYFLVDRSNSIPRARYQLNKQAVKEALAALLPDDTFNILLFDDHVVRLSQQNILPTAENLRTASLFLDEQSHGGMFASTDLYSSLGRVIPQDVPQQEVNTAILLSDGDTFLSKEKQREMIANWTANNAGKVTLFSVASGGGNNLPLLELMGVFNKGGLVYSPQHESVAEKTSLLVQSLGNPVGKEIQATAVTTDKHITISLHPKSVRLPHLYQNRPFVLYGSTNRLSDFILFVQGKYYDQRFDIKKRICFKEAQSATLAVERQWTQLEAQEYFEKYFRDGQQGHLEEAARLLTPLNLPVPLL